MGRVARSSSARPRSLRGHLRPRTCPGGREGLAAPAGTGLARTPVRRGSPDTLEVSMSPTPPRPAAAVARARQARRASRTRSACLCLRLTCARSFANRIATATAQACLRPCAPPSKGDRLASSDAERGLVAIGRILPATRRTASAHLETICLRPACTLLAHDLGVWRGSALVSAIGRRAGSAVRQLPGIRRTSMGYGASKPMASNETAAGQAHLVDEDLARHEVDRHHLGPSAASPLTITCRNSSSRVRPRGRRELAIGRRRML